MLKRILMLLAVSSMVFGQQELKIVSYNIMGMKPGSYPETRLKIIIQNLKQLDPDIIGLQEINESPSSGGSDNQARIIADSLTAFFGIPYTSYYSGTHMAWDGQFREMIGIITKHPVEQQGFADLPKGTFSRKVVWNHIVTPLGRVNFFNTHLDGESTGATLGQAQKMLAYVTERFYAFPSAAVVLTGDLNNVPESESITTLSAALVDSWRKVNGSLPGYTVPCDAPNARIDYVFYKSTKIKPLASAVVMKDSFRGNYPSDHAGVMTTFGVDPLGVHISAAGPVHAELLQNYPNPFNAATVIHYHLLRRGHVTLTIHDLRGRVIEVPVDEVQDAGSHQIRFDAGALPAGLYPYYLVSETGISSGKMVLVR
ncbi:MAG: Endonuclease/Exonuclease/phosphatase family protein [bacterium ADurb.Bin431]|nr:MAG: Endonuclease/Exonuclease/phosphatase family protein [bacterium ADurb.Bin431]